jgi:uncharacterized protein YqjF (DUF2071 family)
MLMLAPSNAAAPSLSPEVSQPLHRWCWAQTWYDLFFAHWRVSERCIRPHIHSDLTVDTWDGSAWVSIVAFRLDVRRRCLAPFGIGLRFVELNLRTYVRLGNEDGIYFLTIHAGTRGPAALARWLTPLPYVYSPIFYECQASTKRFTCRRPALGSPLFAATFAPSGPARMAKADATNAWLLERYAAFVPDKRGHLCRVLAQHRPWQVQKTVAQVEPGDFVRPWGLSPNCQPEITHWSQRMPALLGSFQRIGAQH